MNLSMLYQQFNERLLMFRHQIMWSSYWKEMYDHFLQLCSLVEHVNEFVSPLLVVITLADFFFLCERLYRQYA
jgi:Trehalose receptor